MKDESFAAEESRADFPGERDAEVDVADRAQERVLLAQHLLILQVELDNLARVRARKRDFAGRIQAPEVGDEEALPGEELALQSPEESALHLAVHLDTVGHVHHRARLGANFVAQREGKDHRLHVITDNLVCHHLRDLQVMERRIPTLSRAHGLQSCP